jgi:hypothetical protein
MLLGFAVGTVATTEPAVLAQLEPVGGFLLVLLRIVVATLAFRAGHRDPHTRFFLRHYPVS